MKNKKPFVSIIMNCHNGEEFLTQSLNSIFYQTYKNWELIFWDNNSDDKSKDIILNYKDKRIKYYKSKKFFTLYQARNLAIEKAKGDYICFLDTDDWWDKNKLNIQVNIIKKNKDLKFIFSNFFIYNKNFNNKKVCIKHRIPNGKITQVLLDDYKIGILTVMIKKNIFKKKKFNSKYNIIGDFDYFINLSIQENFYFIDRPLAYYRLHQDNFSKKTKLHIKELNYWIKKNTKKLEKQGFKLNSVKYLYLKLIIRNIFEFFGRVVQW